MNVVALMDERVLFGTNIHPETNRRLQNAVAMRLQDRLMAERMLWEARAEDPACLPVYFALYKFYANGKRLADAERAARLALSEAARQGGFPVSWLTIADNPAQYRLYEKASGPFYLFSLKALAFITLRQGRVGEASDLLDILTVIDPEDRSGATVIRALLQGSSDDDEGGEDSRPSYAEAV